MKEKRYTLLIDMLNNLIGQMDSFSGVKDASWTPQEGKLEVLRYVRRSEFCM